MGFFCGEGCLESFTYFNLLNLCVHEIYLQHSDGLYDTLVRGNNDFALFRTNIIHTLHHVKLKNKLYFLLKNLTDNLRVIQS